MSAKLFCCLCYMPAINDYKHLQNDSAECNEFYNVTIQYFSPKLLTEHIWTKQSTGKSVLCQNCWTHIQDFHDFRQTVLKSRTSLYESNIKNYKYNHRYGEEKTSALDIDNDQISSVSNSDNSDSEVEEVQYVLVMDETDDCDNGAKTSLEQESPVHIKVEADQHSSVCHDDVVNETTKTAFKDTSIQKSPLHIKMEDENDTTVWRGDNSDVGNVAINSIQPSNTQKSPIHFVKESWTPSSHIKVEGQTTGFHNDNVYCRDSELQQNQSVLNDHIDIAQNIDIIDNEEMNNLDECDEKPLYKSKTSCKESKHLFSSDDDVGGDEAIESNAFSTEYKSQPECDICGEACANKLLKVNFNKQQNSKSYYKCFDRYYYICGKLNSCKQTIIYDELQEFKCSNCPNSFTKKSVLKRHMATHAKSFKCDKCSKTYYIESHLKRHMATAHIPKNECSRCNVVLQTPLALKRHKEAYHNICPICGKVSASRKGLKQHKKKSNH